MKWNKNFWIVYILVLVTQLLICNYLRLSPFVMLSILPVAVLCIPLHYGTAFAMVVAFVSGCAIDFLADGVPGLNVLALVPVAFTRKTIVRLIFGEELFAREEDFSVKRSGFMKVFMAILLMQMLFLAIYIAADGAGMRPLWFEALRFAASLAAGIIASLLLIGILAPEEK